nr:hypothetical protein [Candidatus Sigynarchaeum springense]
MSRPAGRIVGRSVPGKAASSKDARGSRPRGRRDSTRQINGAS